MAQFPPEPPTSELALAHAAATEAERVAGIATARLLAVEDQLCAALVEQQEWPLLLAQLEGELAMGEFYRKELEAIKNSHSWKLIWGLMTPYRLLRVRMAASSAQKR